MKTILNSVVVALALAMGTAQAAVIFDINSVVRPGGNTTANTILVNTGNLTTPTTMVLSNGTMAVSAKNGSFVSYFTPQSLAVGQTLTVQYSGAITNANGSSNGFRLGLFSSNGTAKYTTDQAASGATFATYQGYMALNSITVATADGSAYQRGNTPVLYSPTNGESLKTSVPGLSAGNGTAYSGNFSITRTDALTLSVQYHFGNQTVQSFTDNTSIVTSYDTFGIYLNNTLTGNVTTTFTMTQMDISIVPEPSVFLFLLPVFVLGIYVIRRRRRIAHSSA